MKSIMNKKMDTLKRTFALSAIFFAVIQISAQNINMSQVKHLISIGYYRDAAELLRPAAEGGNAEAQMLAGSLFEQGLGVVKSIPQAEKYYMLASNQGHEEATVRLVYLYLNQERKQDAVNVLEQYLKAQKSEKHSTLGLLLGMLYLDDTHGEPIEIERGWDLMVAHKKASNKLPDGQKLPTLEEAAAHFYPRLIEKYISQPDSLADRMGDRYWNQMADAHYPAMLEKIKKLPLEQQKPHVNAWYEVNKACKSYGSWAATNLMIAEAYGYEAPTRGGVMMAKRSFAKVDNNDLRNFPNLIKIKKHVESMLVAGEEIEGIGKIDSISPDGIYHMSNGEELSYEQALAYNQEAINKAAALEYKKNNLTATSRVPQINTHAVYTRWSGGTLEINIRISLKSPNFTWLKASSAYYYPLKGNRGKGKVKLIGLTHKGSYGACIMPNTYATVEIQIDGMPRTGELKSVTAFLNNKFGSGSITIDNVAW